jgi:hypothetical protein
MRMTSIQRINDGPNEERNSGEKAAQNTAKKEE